jgi:ATP/maltotriose-dependent transcriptional regulator MalT
MVPERDRVERSRRAATWLVQAGDLSAAAELALAFPDTAWTAAMVEPQCRSLADRSDFDTLERWIERIPEPVLDSSLDLAYWRIAARFGLGRTYGADALVNELAPRMIASGSSLQSGRLSLCRGLVAFHAGNDTDAGAHLTAALGQLPEDALVERQHASTMAGQLLFRQGHDDEAATAFKQAEISAMHLPLDERWSWFVIAPGRANGYALRGDLFSAITKYRLILAEITPSPASVDIEGFLRCRLVSLHIERNDLDAAKREIERIDELLASDPRPWHRDAVVAKARFLFAHGRQADAETWASEHLTHLRRLPEKPQLVHLLARMWLERGEYPLVESWLADVDPFGYPWVQVFGDIGPRAMAITLDLVRQQYGEAAAAAETMMGEAVSGRHWSEVISLAAQWAVALHGLGQAERSQEVMRSAIERAVPGGFVRALHVPGFDTVAMFADVWAEDREFGQLRRALQDVQGHVEHGDTVSISKRELEVLRLVAEGRTNQQIAEAMYISTNTVRNHLVRISQRLETSNRQEAVARARQLGILY